MIFHCGKLDVKNCSILRLTIGSQQNSNFSASYALQQKLTRDIMSLFATVAAFPARDINTIIVLTSADFAQSQDLLQFCSREKLTVALEDHFDFRTSENGVRESILNFLEKQRWCRVGDTVMSDEILQGSTKKLAQIAMSVQCTSTGDVYLRVTVDVVRIYLMEPWQLGEGDNFVPRWVTVLPKLGKGRVVGVHRQLPPHSPFATYAQMRTYWLNCYGYHLPAGQPECFYDIKFNGLKNTFLYPFFCVWSGNAESVRVLNDDQLKEQAMDSFLEALTKERHTICGMEMNLSRVDSAESAACAVLSALPMDKKHRNQPKIGYFRPTFASELRNKIKEALYEGHTEKLSLSEEDAHRKEAASEKQQWPLPGEVRTGEPSHGTKLMHQADFEGFAYDVCTPVAPSIPNVTTPTSVSKPPPLKPTFSAVRVRSVNPVQNTVNKKSVAPTHAKATPTFGPRPSLNNNYPDLTKQEKAKPTFGIARSTMLPPQSSTQIAKVTGGKVSKEPRPAKTPKTPKEAKVASKETSKTPRPKKDPATVKPRKPRKLKESTDTLLMNTSLHSSSIVLC